MNLKLINSTANAILNKMNDITLPIKIEDIAKSEGLKVMPYPLEDDVSGLLVIENGQGVIGYNENESRVSRRFTVAHELGHYMLHQDQASLFIDKQFKAYRSQTSPKEASKLELEKEANAFAAAILMPENLLKKELEKTNIDLGSEDGLKELSKTFDVSSTAMYFRLTNLQLI